MTGKAVTCSPFSVGFHLVKHVGWESLVFVVYTECLQMLSPCGVACKTKNMIHFFIPISVWKDKEYFNAYST